jgi:hypothetical protein
MVLPQHLDAGDNHKVVTRAEKGANRRQTIGLALHQNYAF